MSTAEVLAELSQIVTELLHAGSGAVASDSRLSGLVPSLRGLGTKVPALARLADAVAEVTESRTDTPRALLQLLLFARQARAALMTVEEVEGGFEAVPGAGPWQTPLPGNEVARLVDLLATRPEKGLRALGKVAEEDGVLDLRLVQPGLQPLVEKYGRHFNLDRGRRPPDWAVAVAPALSQALEVRGDRREACKLYLLFRLGPVLALLHCEGALQEGSEAVRMVALWHLSLGPVPTKLLPALVRLLNVPNFSCNCFAVEAIVHTGPAALPFLVPLIGNEPQPWQWAVFALGKLVDPDKSPTADQARAALQPQVPRLLETAGRATQVTLKCQLLLLRLLAPHNPEVSRQVAELSRRRGIRL
jgi:hypothetical protein